MRLDHILLVAQERQPARLRLLDHRNLDAIDHRHATALEPGRDRFAPGVAGRWVFVVEHLAEARVALQHHARAAPPFGQAEGPGAHRVLADPVAVVFHQPRAPPHR
jgi:hypothetical protein